MLHISAHVRAPLCAAAGCISLLSAVCWVRTCPGGPRAPAPTRAVRVRAHGHRARLGGPRAPRPPPLPLLQTFSQLPDLLRSASRSASLMNYSAVRAPISAPRPPRRAWTGGGGSSPAPRTPLPSPPGAARPSPNPAQPRPARTRAAVSLPPVLSPFRSHPPGRRGAHTARRREQHHSREGGRPRAAGPPPASRGGTPRPRRDPDSSHVSLCARPAQPVRGRPPPAPARGGDAGPHLGAAARCWCRARPHGPALRAPTESPAQGVGVCRLGGGFRPGGASAPQTRIASNPRKAAPWSSGLCFAGLRSPPL